MAFSFALSTTEEQKIYLSCDPAVSGSDDARSAYITCGDDSDLSLTEDPTWWVIRALSPDERVQAERRAGAARRSELGRILFIEQLGIDGERPRAEWRDKLRMKEQDALSNYTDYLDRVYIETIRLAAKIEGYDGDVVEILQRIRPEQTRVQAVTELTIRIQALSTLDPEKKT